MDCGDSSHYKFPIQQEEFFVTQEVATVILE